METVISCKELLLCQKRDRFCRKLVRTAGRHSDFMINHEGLLIKQVSILRNTYQVYIVPQSLVQRVIKIFHNNRGHQGISRTINMMKRHFCENRSTHTLTSVCYVVNTRLIKSSTRVSIYPSQIGLLMAFVWTV